MLAMLKIGIPEEVMHAFAQLPSYEATSREKPKYERPQRTRIHHVNQPA
jgi:hypothetical protein